jgi:hypothetical protein
MISEKVKGIFPRIVLPEIEFLVEPTRVERGQSVVLRWHVKEAEEATLFISIILPKNPEHINWLKIKELGEKVELNNSLELTVEETTAFYLVAQSQQGLSGAKAVVEVADKEPEREPIIWEPQEQFLDRMEDRSDIEWVEENVQPTPSEIAAQIELALRMTQLWFGGTTPPIIKISVTFDVIFADEAVVFLWSVSNAQYVMTGMSSGQTFLVPDPMKTSGNRLDGGGWGSGSSPWGTTMSGSWKMEAKYWLLQGSMNYYVHARNAMGKVAGASVRVDVLSIPQFKGACTPKRKDDIRQALKTIAKKLRNGCIYNNAALDAQVAAFKDGRLNRQDFSYRLLLELQNIGIDTFNCKDVADNVWGGGHWADYTNEIVLDWSPKHTPYLEYVILHELTHKCGFNSDLLKYYSKASIENQAHLISGACFS